MSFYHAFFRQGTPANRIKPAKKAIWFVIFKLLNPLKSAEMLENYTGFKSSGSGSRKAKTLFQYADDSKDRLVDRGWNVVFLAKCDRLAAE
jgi:hypothetical protein